MATINKTQSTNLPWLFSPTVDLLTFTGSAVVSLVLVAVGFQLGWVHSDTPEWTWVTAVLLVDVAHVYSTGFRVYFDNAELRRRPWLYVLAPLLSFVIGMAVYSEGPLLFWRLLAYLAVFHFVRQQYGWVALYRGKANDHDRLGKWIDGTAIYLATLYPLIYWHAHLPRDFEWFIAKDFVNVPMWLEQICRPLYWLAMAAYVGRLVHRGVRLGQWNPGKDLVVLTTAICWYVGIVSLNSDYAFTVTNVIIHGVPYMVLVYWTQRKEQWVARPTSVVWRVLRFLPLLWLLAYAEELIWDRAVWEERSWLFGDAWHKSSWHVWLVPLLAVPQATHYILDGFIWRRRSNKDVAQITQSAMSAEAN
jgi:hypothetical protein